MEVITCGFIQITEGDFSPIVGVPTTGDAVVMNDTLGPTLMHNLTLESPTVVKRIAAEKICERFGCAGIIIDNFKLITIYKDGRMDILDPAHEFQVILSTTTNYTDYDYCFDDFENLDIIE